ncbi:MAG: hypothetical protein HY005_03310 [Candidatus Staskawiczbacteria bacterium]|nr:hypothetical protein [Candidatus Staskawiczbacteria bacterium]MBI3337617.1 hypothetical protein [Candidatus Staskawiczbacteria bacterium]
MAEALPEKIVLPVPEKVPLPKLMEAVLSYQTGVYVTVLNIIQCIAFGFLVNELREIIIKNEFGFNCVFRTILAFAIILLIWHRYTEELQYLWQTSWFDTVGPFFIGIIECVIVFSVNDSKTPLIFFVIFVITLQLLALLAYIYAYQMRTQKATEKLYRDFYKDYPIFADYLIIFLKAYDRLSIKFMVIFTAQTSVFLLLVWIHLFEVYEVFFTLICVSNIITGERFRGFHKLLRTSSILGSCFTKGGD